ncbi:hypothetical protein F2P81_004865 [Scophthalmus maximus]|uniref:SV2A/B/C luminal domain-containing protein n=1 Tax=Scophthalmus maximus TaxID=52904 RepID=A0A6A4TGF6_SCOMX|nr:hypothetical protein F2P81_004865 [Scophthalmus maximus]
MDDPYHNNVNQQVTEGGEYTYTQDGGGYPYQSDYPPQDEDAASDDTEGADEDNQMYEGEYQGVPHPDEIKEARRAARVEARRKARLAAQQEEDEDNLPEQYEAIMEDCGHGRFQWTLFFVLGLALMADGVDGFVVGFVLPSAEKDMCISNADKGLLGWGFSIGSEFQMHSWRLFILVCLFPALAALVGVIFMPESPRFLLESSRHDEAWMILRRVHDTNWKAKGEPERVFTVTNIKTPQTQDDEFIEIQSDTGTAFQRWTVRHMTMLQQVMANIMSLSAPELRLQGLLLVIVWFCLAFSYHGLGVWFPDMIKYMQYEEYESKVRVFHRERVEHFHFNFSLVNQIHREGEYIHDKFANIEIRSVKFEDSLFENCYFEDVKSTNTFFDNCTFKNTIFYNTDLWHEKFKECRMENTTFLHPKKGCHLNFQEENDIVIYMVSFLGSLAVLPGNIISALFMDKIGRIRIIGGSMLVSSACTFLLLLSFSQGAVICWQCLFYGTSVAAWNGLEVISVELYPSSKRGTAFGILNGICKFATIIASFIFAAFIGITKIIPIFLAFAALVCGGLVALKLPETREKILS